MTGMMRLVDGPKVLLVELIAMMDTPRGPELRFRHFSPSLEAWEPQFKQVFRFTEDSADRDAFENTVPFGKGVLSTQPRTAIYRRVDANTDVAHSDLIGDDGKASVIEVTYRRIP